MSDTHGIFRSVEDVLATASATAPRPRSDAAASRARLLALAGAAPRPDDAADPHADETLPDADDARRELEALCAGVVLAREAGARLAVFAEHAGADPDGALVFACLLHLAGDGEGATFWWQLAAGAEVALAASCLFLDHTRRGEFHDAALWLRRLDEAGSRSPATPAGPVPARSTTRATPPATGTVTDAVADAVADADLVSALRPTTEPVVRPAPDAVVHPDLEPIVDPDPDAVVHPTLEPIVDPTVRSVTDPAVRSVVDPVVRSVVDPAPRSARGPIVGASVAPVAGGAASLLTPRVRRVLAGARRWVRHREHEDLGSVPTAGRALAKEVFAISHQPVPSRPGAWMVPLPPTVRRRRQAPAAPPSTPGTPAPARTGALRELPPGRSTAFSALPMRHTSLTALAQQTPAAPHVPDRWAAAMRVLDVLHAVRAARRPLSTGEIAAAARQDRVLLGPLLGWLCRHLLLARLADGSFTVGPLFSPAPAGDRVLRHDALERLLGDLRDTAGAAVYISRYTHGEVDVQHCADGPTTPAVVPYVDFRLAAHASAVGKSLMAQLGFAERMDHLARHRPVRLTQRTITNPATLFRVLDGHGPQASQFDLLEYSDREVCAAVPLTLDAQPACVALSLPAQHFPRLVRAADILSNRSGLLLLTLLAELPADAGPAPTVDGTPPAADRPAPAPSPATRAGRPAASLASGSRPGGLVVASGILTPVPAAGIPAFPTGPW
ncbi:IclR family transcriptional regulator C-terminal domain-containing protein [Streptomyces sp. NPDC051921]|uniref:IclR family transcriptional regulator domain-containing protein n=1 Tax=Streptomyces sp. NPDC051921 TaxID=3155806 RepID=UPI00342AA9DD